MEQAFLRREKPLPFPCPPACMRFIAGSFDPLRALPLWLLLPGAAGDGLPLPCHKGAAKGVTRYTPGPPISPPTPDFHAVCFL